MNAAPSITRLFAATFLAVALVGLVTQVATWRGARATQAAMVDLASRLARPDQAQLQDLQDRAAEAGDTAVQAAVATTVLFISMLGVVGVGVWYTRRRLAAPFARVVAALERVEEGRFAERLEEDRKDELGAIARGVNRMAGALASRERLQEYIAGLLGALNAPVPPDGAGSALGGALAVIATATRAAGIVLYQPGYGTNEWTPTAAQGFVPLPLSRAAVRDLLGDGAAPVVCDGAAAKAARAHLRLTVPLPHGVVLVPLRTAAKLVGVLCVVPGAPVGDDDQAALAQAAPHLAFACERESAHQHTRRLATEVRHVANRLAETNAELDGALRTKDQFLSNVSHELRTPLNSVIGFTDLLLTQDLGGAPLSAQQRDFLDTVARNGRHLLRLINDLLDLQRIAAGKMEVRPVPVELAGLLTEAASSVRAQADQHRHQLVVEAPPRDVKVRADAMRVHQVLLNFLSNAIKFTPDGGRITVSVAPANGGAAVRVAVTDSGIGIAPEDQDKLFHEFVQLDASTSRRYEGTGLGLALSRRLIELHGGATGVESALGIGSTFWFTLPRADGTA